VSATSIFAIFRKDLLDAIRDARILVSLAVPIALALFYNAVFPEERLLTVKLAYAAGEPTAIIDAIKTQAGATTELRVIEVANEAEARRFVSEGTADVALVIPSGTDASIREGRPASVLEIVKGRSNSEIFLSAALERAFRDVAGQRPPATVRVDRLENAAAERSQTPAFAELGSRRFFVLATVVMLLGMIGLLAVPVILTEEMEKRTIDALFLIVRQSDVIVAKVLVGLTYAAVGVPLMLGLTRIAIHDLATFAAGTLLLALALVAVGLLAAGAFRTATRTYTWSGFLVLVAFGPAVAVGFPLPAWADGAMTALPTAEGMRLMTNGIAGRSLFADEWRAYLVLALWIAVSVALLRWQLGRREG
jgi:hypothetical protein